MMNGVGAARALGARANRTRGRWAQNSLLAALTLCLAACGAWGDPLVDLLEKKGALTKEESQQLHPHPDPLVEALLKKGLITPEQAARVS